MKLGLQPKFAGFDYLREAVALYYSKSELEEKLTTDIYPKVAEKFDVNETIVERDIRVVISVAYKNGGFLALNEYCGTVVYTNSYTLSNLEVVSIVTEILLLNEIKEKLQEFEKEEEIKSAEVIV